MSMQAQWGTAISTTLERFWSRVQKTDGCWNWTGAFYKNTGYGQFYVGGKLPNGRYRCARAHKFAWELQNGTVPNDMLICHTCDNPACVNPAHLYLGTSLDNNHDRSARHRDHNGKKTHCPQGHPYLGNNLYLYKGSRRCWKCMKANVQRMQDQGYFRAYRQRKKVEVT